jgi:hypothetical protein
MFSFRSYRPVLFAALVAISLAAVPAAADNDINEEWEGVVPEGDDLEVGFTTTIYPMIFPHLAGETHGYSDTFGACRGTNCSRRHNGIDIMADKMVPIVAVASGTVGWMHDDQGGNCCAMELNHDDGWESWYIHMNNDTPGTDDGQGWGFADGIVPGAEVEAGQLIGWVGDSGNAEGTAPHTHFELHDPTGTVINPYESLLAATVIYEPYSPANAAGCDFDADGYDDLVVGVPFEDRGLRLDDGAVIALPGGSDGPDATSAELWSQKSAGIKNAPEGDDRFGTANACGDVDGDGYDDLIVGIPGEDQGKRDAGALNVISGSASGLEAGGDNFWHQNRPGVPDSNNKWDALGSALAAGDFNGDGYDDIAVGAPGEAIAGQRRAGMVLVFDGDPGGFGAGNVSKWTQLNTGTGEITEGDRFGAALAAGDFNGDGYADLAIGAGDDGADDTGLVTVIYGGSGGLAGGSSVGLMQGVGGMGDGADAGDHFGAALAAGDFDDDGYADLGIGVPGETVGGEAEAGAVHIVPGASGGLDTGADWIIEAGVGGAAPVAGSQFGASLTAAGFTADAYRDLAIGVPGHGDGAGSVVVVDGSATGLDVAGATMFSQESGGVPNQAAAGDGFATWLSSGDFSGTGSAWLVVGVPLEDFSNRTDSGAVHALPGGLGGITGHGSLFLKQNTPGIPGANEAGDGFGHLAVIGR